MHKGNKFTIRNCLESDLEDLVALWKICDLTLGASDTVLELKRLLNANPTTCLICELNGEVIGGVMGGFDGRRGLVHHLAVHPAHRQKGIGKKLMFELDKRFRKLKVVKYSFWIEGRNRSLVRYYEALGYELRDFVTMTKTLIE